MDLDSDEENEDVEVVLVRCNDWCGAVFNVPISFFEDNVTVHCPECGEYVSEADMVKESLHKEHAAGSADHEE